MTRAFLSVVFVLGLLTAAPVIGQEAPEFVFRPVVQSDDPVPDGLPGEVFQSVVRPRIGPGGEVVFWGLGRMSTRGIYLAREGIVERVVDNRTPIPGGDPGDTFDTDVDPHSVQGNAVAFKGWTNGFENRQGLYLWVDGEIVVVANQTMTVPGGEPGERFSSFGLPWVGPGGTVTFSAVGATAIGTRGIYRWQDGVFEILVDTNAVVPGLGGDTFQTICCDYADPDDVVFVGRTADFRGVFKRVGASLSLVSETGSLGLSLINDTAYFTGFGPDGGWGIYRERNQTITALVDETTPTPPGGPPGTTLCCFQGPGASALGVAFRAHSNPTSPGDPALYWWSDGSIWRMIADGDVIDGRQILGVSLTHDGVSGNLLPLTVTYTDFQHAVYVVEVRIPSVLEVPTLSPVAVAVLVAFMAIAGSWLVRRGG